MRQGNSRYWLNVPTTESHDCKMSRLKLWSDLMVWNDIMHEHDNHRDLLPPLTGAFYESKTQSNVAIMRDWIIVWRGFQETIKRSHCSANEWNSSSSRRTIPTSKEWSDILLRFYDTWTYYYIYKNLLALCSSSPAPLLNIILIRIQEWPFHLRTKTLL